MDLKKTTNKMEQAARAGGRELLKYFGSDLQRITKSNHRDFYTKADVASEEAVLRILAKEFPGFNIFSEESGKVDKGSEYTFIVDPLDGTSNFTIGIPNFSVSIGLTRGDNVVAGVVYIPILNRIFTASTGNGSRRDGKHVQVSSQRSIANAVVTYNQSYTMSPDLNARMFKKITDIGCRRYLSPWSPAYDGALLASGSMDANILNQIDFHDYAAAMILAKEAGGTVLQLPGNTKEPRVILAATPQLADALAKLMK